MHLLLLLACPPSDDKPIDSAATDSGTANDDSGTGDSGTDDSGERDCEWGFEWDGSSCVDIDECAADNGGCGDATVWACENLEGAPPACNFDCSVDYTALSAGVSTIEQGGSLPSLLIVHGESACPVVVDEAGRTFVAMARYGSGRVLHTGHEGMITAPQDQGGDNAALLLNALRWAGQSATPVVGVEPGMESLAGWLEGQGFTVSVVAADSLDGIGVYVKTSYTDHDEAEDTDIRDRVAGGMGLIQGGHAWWWAYSNPGAVVATDYMGNHILNPMGITVTDGTVDAGQDTLSAAPPSTLLHATRALDAIAAHLDGADTLSNAEQVAAATTVRTAVQYLPLSFSSYFDPVRAVLGGMSPVIPTSADPVDTAAAPLEALVVTLWTKLAQESPPHEVQAVPADFPGAVDAGAPRITETVALHPEYAGRDGDYWYAGAQADRWFGTGLYVPPGEVVTVTVPAGWVGAGLGLRIGAHSDTLWHLNSWERYPDITRVYDIDTAIAGDTVEIASGFGGPLYLTVPPGVDAGAGDLTVSGAVMMPRYVAGVTTPEEWQQQLGDSGAPMAEFEAEDFILTVLRDEMLEMDDPGPLTAFWQEVLDADADLAAISRDRARPERMVGDRQISAGWMHSGYPIMTYSYGATLTDVDALSLGEWGAFHELGHNHQFGPQILPGTTEATCNLWSVYVSESVTGISRDAAHPAIAPADREATIDAYIAGGRDFAADWSVWTALETYLQLQEAFGWEFLINVNAAYLAMSPGDRPGNDQARIDRWVLETSYEAGMDLTPFYDAWGFPLSASTYDALSGLEPWTDHPMAGR